MKTMTILNPVIIRYRWHDVNGIEPDDQICEELNKLADATIKELMERHISSGSFVVTHANRAYCFNWAIASILRQDQWHRDINANVDHEQCKACDCYAMQGEIPLPCRSCYRDNDGNTQYRPNLGKG